MTGTRRKPPLLFAVPAALAACVVLLPVAYLVVRAVSGEGGLWAAWEYSSRLGTVSLLWRSVALAAGSTALAVVVAVPLAWLTGRTDMPLRRVFTVLAALPLVFPSYVMALVAISAMGPRGPVARALEWVGVDGAPAAQGYIAAVVVIAMVTFPYAYLPVRAALRRMDPGLEEASRALGRGGVGTFFGVVLPQLRPAIAAGALLVALYTVSDFGAVSLLRYDSFTRAIYVHYQSSFDRTGAAVLSLHLVLLSVVILAGEEFARGRRRYDTRSVARKQRPVRLGRWRWAAAGACGLVGVVTVIAPVGVLTTWLVRGIAAGEEFRALWGAVWGSVLASGIAAVVTVACAVPVAVLATRYPSRVSTLIERTTHLGFALPGIVVALGLVFFSIRAAPVLYQSLALLVLAYGVLYLPQAVGSARASLGQVGPHLEEAARGLGHGTASVLMTVTVPLITPGLMAGAALVFLSCMKELPATLLLSPIGYETLATSIWQATTEAFYARAAAPALLLVVVSAGAVAIILRREGV